MLHPVMNDTKWNELRLGMSGLGPLAPRWRTRDTKDGHVSDWDREWFYHFRAGGYVDIEWVEIEVSTAAQRQAVAAVLRAIRVPGETIDGGFRVYGYVETGRAVDYLGD